MKVVIDTSVWISALISRQGGAREVLRLALSGRIEPQISEALFCEYEAVMRRESVQAKTPLNREEQQALFEAFLSTCRWNEIYYAWRPNLPDADDDFIVELAVAGGAERILTYNLKDFQKAQLRFAYTVSSPEEFLKEYR